MPPNGFILGQRTTPEVLATDFSSTWENWDKNLEFTPRQIFVPKTPNDLMSFIVQSNKDDRRVRVLGSGWSFSDVAISHDYLVRLDNWNRVLAFSQGAKLWGHSTPPTGKVPNPPPLKPDSPVLNAAIAPAIMRTGRRFAHVQAGMRVRDFYIALDSPHMDSPRDTRGRWALPTMGGDAGQTVGGVISTCTHGADFGLGPIHEAVRAIDLIAPDGTRHWIEPSQPNIITDPKKLGIIMGKLKIQVHYDDDWFGSVLVAMGCLGIVHSYVVELIDQFGLSQRVGKSTWLSVRPLLASGTIFSTMPPWAGVPMAPHPGGAMLRALEVIINPYRISDDYQTDPLPDRFVQVTSRASNTEVDPPEQAGGGPDFITTIVDAVKFKNGGPGTVKDVIQDIVGSLRSDTKGKFPVAWSIMDGGQDPDPITALEQGSDARVDSQDPILSLEIAIPTERNVHLMLVDDMLDAFDKIILSGGDNGFKLGGALSLRFTKPSDTFQAIQNFGSINHIPGVMVCHIEVPTVAHVDGLGNRLYDPGPNGLPMGDDLDQHGAAFLQVFEHLARNRGAHLHWGQLSLTKRHDPQSYPQFATWHGVRNQLTNSGMVRSFDSDFTVRYDISIRAPHWEVLSKSLLPGSPTSQGRNGNPSKIFQPNVFRNKDGSLELLTIGPDGQVCWNRQGTSGSAFLGWSFVKIPGVTTRAFGGRAAVGINRSDHHPEVFALDLGARKICHAWRWHVSDTTWGPTLFTGLYGALQEDWSELDSDPVFDSSPDVAMAGDQNLLVVARRTDGEVAFRGQKVELGVVGWNSWKLVQPAPKSGKFVGDPCIAQNHDSRLEVFARDGSGMMWHSVQNKPRSDSDWSAWKKLGKSPIGGDPGAGRNSDGRIEVFARGVNDVGLFHLAQTKPGIWSASTDWTIVDSFDIPLAPFDRPSVILSKKNLQVGVLAKTANIFHLDQNGGVWKVNDLGRPFSSYPALGENSDGRLEIFAKFDDDLVQHLWQDSSFAWVTLN